MSHRYRLGLVVPSGGSPAMYAPTFFTAAELAAKEMNEAGGVLGRKVELMRIRVGPNALHDHGELFREIERSRPHGLIVCHDSYVREVIINLVGARVPVFYPPIWEGGRQRHGVLCTGDNTPHKTWSSIRWLAENAAATDWSIVGTNYLWPTVTARTMEPWLAQRDWWHGTHLVPYSLLDDLDGDERVVGQLIATVETSDASCVLVLLHGSQLAMFNREFAARGLDEHILRFAPMADETVLLASGPGTTRGLLTAFGEIESELLPVPGRPGFLQRFATLHGPKAPVPTGVTLAGYEGVVVAATVASRAGRLNPTPRDLAMVRNRGFEFDAPTGTVRVERHAVTRPMNLLAVEAFEYSRLAQLS